jgi:HD-like signal output (HDOD) protein
VLRLFKKKTEAAEKQLRLILGDYELPSFPEIVMGVLDLLRDPEATSAEIAERLAIDPGMHVKVMKTVNSASFGLTTTVTNLTHAVNLLGRARLESIVVSIAVKTAMPPLDPDLFDSSGFWRSSACRAGVARRLAHHLHPSRQAEAFTAGLLQDLAVPVLVAAKGSAYCDAYNGWKTGEHRRLDTREKELFGFHHAYVGGLAAEMWGLPEYLVKAIRSHHEPEEDEVDPAVRVVSELRDGAVEEDVGRVVRDCSSWLDLSAEQLEEEVTKALADAREFYLLLG